MKKEILTIAVCSYCLLAFAQERVLITTFENTVPYDSLSCEMSFENRENVRLSGIYHKENNSWTFNFPDSLYWQYKRYNFWGKYKESPDISYVHPSFRFVDKKDTTLFTSFPLFWEDTDTLFLHARLVKQDTIRNCMFYGMDKVVLGHSFDLLDPSPELRRSIVNSLDLFMKYEGASSEQLEEIFANMISQAPESRSSMRFLYERKHWFTLQQLSSLYALFSKIQQQSYYGLKMNEFMQIFMTKFQDTLLSNSLTGKKETIVMDESKYTLLMFSASWCAPCHELIPTLKELYEKKKDVLNIVYVTLDEPRYLPAWQKFIKEKSIPWRSLSVDGKIDEIREKYKVPSIPYSFLIYPRKMKVERVEIRDEEDKVKIETL